LKEYSKNFDYKIYNNLFIETTPMSFKRLKSETNDNIYPSSKHVKMDDTIDDLIIDAIKEGDIYYIETLLFTGAITENQLINGYTLYYWVKYHWYHHTPYINFINLIKSYKK